MATLELPDFVPDRPAREAHRALVAADAAADRARHCAVLWFGEILRRGLYRDLGYGSMPQYAKAALGFSASKTTDFMTLAQKLDALPAVRAELAAGRIGYTKAREVVKVATARTDEQWAEEARTRSRQELAQRVRAVQAKAQRRKCAQLELAPAAVAGAAAVPVAAAVPRVAGAAAAPAVPAGAGLARIGLDPLGLDPAGLDAADLDAAHLEALAREVPVRVGLVFTPEQHARWEAAWERLRKRRGLPGARVEVLLDALDALAGTDDVANSTPTETCESSAPRGAMRPPVQIHAHLCPQCGRTEVDGRPVARAEAGRLQCDAAVASPGGRNTTTIPPRVRREVLARDRHTCQAPGCGRRRYLEVHHVVARSRGGANTAENLVTLCSACHRVWHERCGDIAPGTAPAARSGPGQDGSSGCGRP